MTNILYISTIHSNLFILAYFMKIIMVVWPEISLIKYSRMLSRNEKGITSSNVWEYVVTIDKIVLDRS